MIKIKNNIWFLYILLVLFASFLLTVHLRRSYTATEQDLIKGQSNRINLISLSLNSLLHHQDQMISFIENILSDSGPLPEEAEPLPLFDEIVVNNSSLSGLVLLNERGDSIFYSSNMDSALMVNAYSALSPEWTEVFIRALNSDGVVMGKTCLYPPLGEVIIPLMKALYNDEGELLGVIGLGLDIESSTDLFSGHLHMGNDDVVYLLRDRDGYVQYRSSEIELGIPYYREPIPEEMMAISAGRLEEKYSMTLEEIKAKGGIDSLRTTDRWGQAVISTMAYLESYGLWIVSDFHMIAFTRRFRPILIMDLSFFFSFLAVTFLLIWTIDQSERKKQEALLR